MADYRSDWLSLESALDAAFLTASPPGLRDRVVLNPHAPSAVRVLGKSMYVLAAGWIVSIAWLWIATLQQHLVRQGIAPDNYALDTIGGGLFPALIMGLIGLGIDRWAGPAPHKWLHRREWVHAFWWSFVPNVLLFITVWIMIRETR
jgi:hypothetical protein